MPTQTYFSERYKRYFSNLGGNLRIIAKTQVRTYIFRLRYIVLSQIENGDRDRARTTTQNYKLLLTPRYFSDVAENI